MELFKEGIYPGRGPHKRQDSTGLLCLLDETSDVVRDDSTSACKRAAPHNKPRRWFHCPWHPKDVIDDARDEFPN